MYNSTPLPSPPDPMVDPAGYLLSIYSVRERSRIIMDKAIKNELANFNVTMSKLKNVVEYVLAIIKRDFAPSYRSIPPHGRWQHFNDAGHSRLDALLETWNTNQSLSNNDKTKKLLDLILVSVLLDAGAGNTWKYKSLETGSVLSRSEGLGIASLEMFTHGLFSSDPSGDPCRVDGAALRSLTVKKLAQAFQVQEDNLMDGLDGRTGVLTRLGDALKNKQYFGQDERPGNLLDYLLTHPTTHQPSAPTQNESPIVPLPTLWTALTTALAPIWPATRTQIAGISLGDAWPCSSLPSSPPAQPWESIAPFHKLTQWLTYSLLEPMRRVSGIRFSGVELMTGLPEYRNGGLLVDMGLMTLKDDAKERGLENCRATAHPGTMVEEATPMFPADDDVIVEWRAVTVGMLDEIHEAVNKGLGLQGEERLSLAQVLEAGTWKAGREIAAAKRPKTKGPPIRVVSDGTVF